MARALSLVVSVLLVSSSSLVAAGLGRGTRRLLSRDVLDDFEECTGSEWETDLLTRFTGIFFGDFYTGGDKDIWGALAVEGNMHAPNYIVNLDHGADCSAVNSFNSYGLVVGGTVDTFNTNVHGSAYIAGGGTVEEVLELDDGCFVTDQKGTGIFDFALVKELLQNSNQNFAEHPPTAILENNAGLTELRDNQLTHYEILTFHTCQSTSCSMDKDLESNPDHIFFNKGSWNGVHSFDVNPDKTYILNIPVTDGATFTLTTPHPSQGFYPCNLIYNLYPVGPDGKYLPTGSFTFHRKNSDNLLGFVLAPLGHILDGNTGNFAGTVVGLDYTWQNLNSGAEIKDYRAGGADCDYYEGCIPDHVTTTPTPVFPTSESTSTSTSTRTRTRTWSLTRPPNLFSRSRTTTLTYDTIVIPTIGATLIDVETTTRTRTRTRTRTTVVSDSSTTFTTDTIETEVSTETETTTETETIPIFTETSCPSDNTHIVTIDSTETDFFDSTTEFVTVTEPAHTTTLTVTTDIFTATETDSIISVTDYATTTKRKLYLKPVTRTRTECIDNICGTVTVTEGSSETCYEDHHHGHHHGPGEKCEEGGDDYDNDDDDDDDEDEKKHYHGKGNKKNYDDDGDEDEEDKDNDYY